MASADEFHSDFHDLFSRFLNDRSRRLIHRSAAFTDIWECCRDIQHSLPNPTPESTLVFPDSIIRSFKLRTNCERELGFRAMHADGICLRQVHKQSHHGSDSLHQMKNGLDKAFWNFSMKICDLQVKAPSHFPILDAVETFFEFRDCSSAVSQLTCFETRLNSVKQSGEIKAAERSDGTQ
jgi:hypothetical protein